jgi:hypothetical protein
MSIKLDLITINPHDLVDQPTLASYMSEGADPILEKNRPFYSNSKEICINGIYFALTTFAEADSHFTVLSLYKRSPRQKKTYRYSFGAYDPAGNQLYWFFNAESQAQSRDLAVRTFNALTKWCDDNCPTYTPFAYKK